MPLIEKHAPGSFSWVELGTTDQNAAKSFYEKIFGWSVVDHPMGPDGVYTMFKLRGYDVGAAYTMREEQRKQGVPPHWMLYIAVDNADAAVARAASLGATILAPAFDVMDIGRMAVIQDPTGAIFSVWQAKTHIGIRLNGVEGTLCWADLTTPDVARAKEFYSGLFGWSISAGEKDPSGYLHIKNGEQFIGGVPPAHQRNPAVPPHWLLYFYVADVDEVASKATAAGASLHLPPMSIEDVGRMSVMADPQGAVFAIFKDAPRPAAPPPNA